MQILPSTARHLGFEPKLLWDPQLNISVGTQYLETITYDCDGDIVQAIMMYNAGPKGKDLKIYENAHVRKVIHEYMRIKCSSNVLLEYVL